jgi:hypothetical protein
MNLINKNSEKLASGVPLRGIKTKNSILRLKSSGEPWHRASQLQQISIGGVCSKKFEQISSKICRASGIPPKKKPFRQLAEATLSDLPACLPAGRPAGRLDNFKFFFGGKLLCKKR